MLSALLSYYSVVMKIFVLSIFEWPFYTGFPIPKFKFVNIIVLLYTSTEEKTCIYIIDCIVENASN